MSYPVGKRTKVKGQPGLYIYAGQGRINGKQPLCFYFVYRKSGYIKVGWNHEGFTLEDAKAQRDKYVHAMRNGEQKPDPKKFEVDFKSAGKMFLQHLKDTHVPSWKNDTSIFNNHLAKHFGREPISLINTTSIEKLMGKLTRTYSTNYQSAIIGVLRRFFKYLKSEGYCKEDPSKRMRVKKKVQIKDRYLEIWEIDAMLAYCDEKVAAARTISKKRTWKEVRAQILLGVEMGLRRSEMYTPPGVVELRGHDYSLLWERINFETGSIRIVGKGDKERTIKMTPRVKDALIALVPKMRGKVFTTLHNKRILAVFDELGFNEGLDISNTEDRRVWCSMHTLRHTFGTYAMMKLKRPHLVAELMGHTTIQTTAVYAHLIKGSDDQAMDELGEWYVSQSAGSKVVPLRQVK